MLIFSLGFRQALLAQLDDLDDLEQVARVVLDGGHAFRLHNGETEWLATLAGRVKERPAVGDFVLAEDALITGVIPRANAVERRAAGSEADVQVLAANVDQVALVEPLGGAPNLRRIERGLTLAHAAGASGIVVLTKRDLVTDDAPLIEAVQALNPSGHVLAVSAVESAGVDEVAALLSPGTTTVLLGASGAGKSTLLNRLLGDDVLATRAVRAGDGKGRHTTTARHLLMLEGGAMVIDTPGTRELGLFADEADVEASFADVMALAARCRFRDCAHEAEPGCALRAAVDEGALDPARLASFHKQRREARHLMERQHGHLRRARERGFARVVAEATKQRRQE